MCFLASSLQKQESSVCWDHSQFPSRNEREAAVWCAFWLIFAYLPFSPFFTSKACSGTLLPLRILLSASAHMSRLPCDSLGPLPPPSGHFLALMLPIKRVDRGNEKIRPQCEKTLLLIKGPAERWEGTKTRCHRAIYQPQGWRTFISPQLLQHHPWTPHLRHIWSVWTRWLTRNTFLWRCCQIFREVYY